MQKFEELKPHIFFFLLIATNRRYCKSQYLPQKEETTDIKAAESPRTEVEEAVVAADLPILVRMTGISLPVMAYHQLVSKMPYACMVSGNK